MRLIALCLLGGAMAALFVPAPAAAQERRTLTAVRTSTPIKLDGRLDEQIYASVPPASDFIQLEPIWGAPATEKTEVWILFDAANVYVTFRCWESDLRRVVANEMRRDSGNIRENDEVEFILDTFYDRRNAVRFQVNPLGGRIDGQLTDERAFNSDWNPVWDVKADWFENGWIVEAAIPFKSLRYRPGQKQVWGFNAQRKNRAKNELSFITRLPKNNAASKGIWQISQAATLEGLEAPPLSRNIEVKPYVISSVTSDLRRTPALSNDLDGDFGVDAKYGVTQNLTADFTYNTDFAQVEADEQQVNLTRFSLFFPEKREFFLENRGTFAFGGSLPNSTGADAPVLFYSRRIGLQEGRAIPVLGGGRLTGRAGPYSLGLLGIRTDDDAATGAEATTFSVVRVKRDFLRRSSFGALATARSRGEAGGAGSEAYGVDATVALFDNLVMNTYWARAPVDSGRGSDTSYRGLLDYAGDRYGVQLDRLVVGDAFDPQVGFVRRRDMRRSYGVFRFSPRLNTQTIRRLSWIGSVDHISNGSGVLETRAIDGQFGFEYQNSDKSTLGYAENYERLLRQFAIAPGVVFAAGEYDFSAWTLGHTLGPQRRLSGAFSVTRGSFYSGRRTTLDINTSRVNITTRFAIEPTVSFNWITLDEGAFTTHVDAARVTYTVSPLAFVSALIQYSSASRTLGTNVRLRWEYRPGSELFLVYNDQRDSVAGRPVELMNRSFVFKINRLFRF